MKRKCDDHLFDVFVYDLFDFLLYTCISAIEFLSTSVEKRSTDFWQVVDCYEHAITARYPLHLEHSF